MRKNAKFDRGQVIDKALNLYWEKGFHGTSMRNLQDVIDMRPGSIYATFGSKEGLFKEALVRYTQLGIEQLRQCRESVSSPLLALKTFTKLLVINTQKSAPSSMCMLTKTVAELTIENAELLNQAKKSLKLMENEFAKLITEAQEMGEVAKDKDPKQLARYVQIQISGLRSYAITSDADVPFEQLVEEVFAQQHF